MSPDKIAAIKKNNLRYFTEGIYEDSKGNQYVWNRGKFHKLSKNEFKEVSAVYAAGI